MDIYTQKHIKSNHIWKKFYFWQIPIMFQMNGLNLLKKKNIKTFNGLNMFVYQGQKSFYIWTKQNPEIDEELLGLLENKIKQ